MDKIDIRVALHRLIGHLRRNEWVEAFILTKEMSDQMDNEYYSKEKQ